MFGLTDKEIVKRNPLIFYIAKSISNIGYKLFSRNHIEDPHHIGTYRNDKQAVFFFVGLHKSLWETTGVLSAFHSRQLPIPYVGMGDNLIKGRFFQTLSMRAGIFLVKRAKTPREIMESSKKLKSYLLYYLAKGQDVALFPEGTRRNIPDRGVYGDFFPTAFDAVLDYHKNRETYLQENPVLTPRNVFIVPVNADYSIIREAHEMVLDTRKTPRTLKVHDSLKMIRQLGDIYISFGKPVAAAEVAHMNRKELAVHVRGLCLDLVKILPVNIVAQALAECFRAGDASEPAILRAIDVVRERLLPHSLRFRGMTPEEPARTLLEKVQAQDGHFREIDHINLPLYRLYANYIHHIAGSV